MKNDRKRRPWDRNSNGYSLYEVMTVMTVGSFLMSLAIGWIYVTFKHSDRFRLHQRQHQTLTRLARELRNDLQQASSVSIGKEREVVVEKEQLTTKYRISTDRMTLQKTVTRGGAESNFEQFQLSRSGEFQWETDELPNVVSLVVKRKFPATKSESAKVAGKGSAENEGAGGSIVLLRVRSGPKFQDLSYEKTSPGKPENVGVGK